MTSSSSFQRFPTTRWTTVLGALGSPSDGRAALESLCARYWFPLYSFARRQGYAHAAAEDLVQDFLARFLETRDWRVDPTRGRFRAYLAASLRNFIAHDRERARAHKRGHGHVFVTIDPDSERRFVREIADAETPDRAYERSFALALLDGALDELAAEQRKIGRSAQFERLKPFLGPDTPAPPYAEIARELDATEGALRVALHRLRRRYGELVRLAVADLVADPADVDSELQALADAFAR